VGAVAGYFGGKIDALIMRIVDIVLAFPGLLLALYLAAVMPPSFFSLVFALSATGWVSYARIIRARVYEVKTRDFITAARALGASHWRIISRHLLPNIMGPLIVQASFGLSAIILAEAGLTFLGLGLPLGTPSWGALLDQGVSHLFNAPYLAIFPGIAIALSVLAFNFVGDGLRDILDPKSPMI
jgi:peptide/nickel transport system permease protein